MVREMKNSGIPWIGRIPSSWNVAKVKYGFCRKNSKAHQANPIVLSLARSGVHIRDLSKNEGQIAESYVEYNPVAIGDLLLNPMDLYSGANCSYSNVAGVISPAYINLRSKDGIDAHFYDYYFKVQYWMMAFFAYGKGVSFDNRWTLSTETLSNWPIIVPAYEEQLRISSFLGRKCAEIDAVLEKTRASIEEYKKLKQAIITQAVTKGIRGDRPMKKSKIVWASTVPKEWIVCKTLYCLSMPITDGPHTTPELYNDGIAFVSAEAVSCGDGQIDFSHIRGYISSEFYQECCKKYVPQIDDIYMIKSGATTGRVAIVDTEMKFTIWSPLAVFRCNGNMVLPKFMFYFLQSIPYQKQIELGWSYGTQQNIGMRTLEKLRVFIPPLDEQKEIIKYLDRTISGISLLIRKKEQIFQEIDKYKKTVIYEYVTGKKEV